MARGNRVRSKNTLIVATAKAVNPIVSLQQSACSAISRGFAPYSVTGSHFFKQNLLYKNKFYASVLPVVVFIFWINNRFCSTHTFS